MPRKRHKPEEIVAKLRQVDVLTAMARAWPAPCARSGSQRWIVIESWRRHYNAVRPHASLGYRPPALEVFMPGLAASSAAQPRPASPKRLPPTPHLLAPRPTMN